MLMRLSHIRLIVTIAALCPIVTKAQLVVPDVMYQRDSVVELSTDSTVLFFQQGEKLTNLDKTTVITKAKKTMTLAKFLASLDMANGKWIKGVNTDPENLIDYALSDLDNDGKKELVVTDYTGGAHCCDEFYIYKNIAPNKYQHVAKLYAGHTSINGNKEFEYGLHEQFGYFFTCYACGYSDTSDAAPIPIRSIKLRYANGKMTVVPGDQELKSILNDNLGKLSERPYEKLDAELNMDEGLRKEFAMNLAVFYYSFGRNINTTKALFTKYYKHPDAAKVWTAFNKSLLSIKMDSDF